MGIPVTTPWEFTESPEGMFPVNTTNEKSSGWNQFETTSSNMRSYAFMSELDARVQHRWAKIAELKFTSFLSSRVMRAWTLLRLKATKTIVVPRVGKGFSVQRKPLLSELRQVRSGFLRPRSNFCLIQNEILPV